MYLILILLSRIIMCKSSNVANTNLDSAEINSKSTYKLKTMDYNTESSTTEKKFTTENPFQGRNNESDFSWLDDALKDIAYYLRSHKFNEYDRRYETNPDSSHYNYFKEFPRPPLRSLHWEVHKYCEPSYLSCVEYLKRQIRHTGLKRVDDTAIVIQEQQWNYTEHSKQIDAVESDCRKMQRADDIAGDPFQGPIERFQWRTTASYYMCWYSMNEVADLGRLKENCDNFANCLDPNFGIHNKDPRANDNLPYSCVLYSFCPDPCCPLKHLYNFELCWENPANPCFVHNPIGQRQCSVNRSQNIDFRDIVLNRWNVTCKCSHVGYEWNSKYGMCVDIDECLNGLHDCNPEHEGCVNLPGSFRCACRWGFTWNAANKICDASSSLEIIKLHNIKPENLLKDAKAPSIAKILFNMLFAQNSCYVNYGSYFLSLVSISISIYECSLYLY